MPEVFDVIQKYKMFSKFGWGCTLSSMENETFLDIQLMSLCEQYENKALSMKGGKNTMMSPEMFK